MRANIHERQSIEKIYPRAVFEQEARSNLRAKTTVQHGVRIHSMPDDRGEFELTRATRHIAEAEDGANSAFLCPYAQAPTAGGESSGPKETGPPPSAAYDAFIDQVLETARRVRFDRSPGPGEVRLMGPRQ